MKHHGISLLTGVLLVSCNLTESSHPTATSLVSIAPRLEVAGGVALPVTDSVHVKLTSTSPTKTWYESTLPWSAKFVVISGVPSGTAFTLAMEGKAKQPDGTQAIWWSGSQTGTAAQAQTVDAQVLTVPVAVRDTVSPKIVALSRDTILDSAVAGVRLRWNVTDVSLGTVTLNGKGLTPASNIVTDSVTVAVGGSVKAILKATDNVGNVSLDTIVVSRKSAGNAVVVTNGIPWNESIHYDTLTDARDGQKYRTVLIGSQTWMAQNLNYAGKANDTGVCYNNSPDSCAKYGRLYTWNETMAGAASSSAVPSGVQGVCPTGWHVPSDGEWVVLQNFVDASNTVGGTKLKSTNAWGDPGNGTDDYGFRALPSGNFNGSDYIGTSFNNVGYDGIWWSSAEHDVSSAWNRRTSFSDRNLVLGNHIKSKGISLRCTKNASSGTTATAHDSALSSLAITGSGTLKPTFSKSILSYTDTVENSVSSVTVTGTTADGTNAITYATAGSYSTSGIANLTANAVTTVSLKVTNANGNTLVYTVNMFRKDTSARTGSGRFTDIRDGQTYRYVTIGTQVWMAENLRYVVDSSWCPVGITGNCATYGRLYQWSSVMALAPSFNSTLWGGSDVKHQGICPSGWHIPSDAEWTKLTDTALDAAIAGTKLRANSSLWSTNTGTDDYGFAVLPSGARNPDGTFGYPGGDAYLWSASEQLYQSSAWYRRFYYGSDHLKENVIRGGNDKAMGFSLRCLKD